MGDAKNQLAGMSSMKHGISEQDWEDYSEGRLTDEARDRIEAHLIGCLSCWEFYEQYSNAGTQMRDAGAEVRRALSPSDERLHAALGGVFRRLGAQRAPGALRVQLLSKRLSEIEMALAAMCGPRTAARALRAAASCSPARTLECVTTDNWESFLSRLTSIATVMCGETGAQLIREGGRMGCE